MIRRVYTFELITPCLMTGVDSKQAELRTSAIRGQLRWWFRVLGGFKSLSAIPLREQEALLFGTAAGDEGTVGALQLRIRNLDVKSSIKDGQGLGHANFSDSAFLTFPIQSRESKGQKTKDDSRGVIESGTFDIEAILRISTIQKIDLDALFCCFGNLASLGYRSRRAMGAIRLMNPTQLTLQDALKHFQSSNHIIIKSLPATSSKNAISSLGRWLKSCRSHGRSGQNEVEKNSPFFKYAKNDHDIGYKMRGTEKRSAFRPALGLPIIQRTTKGTNNWEWNWQQGRATGRFASPVILRPHLDSERNWHALVIFVESHKWPEGKKVFLNEQPRDVSLELYEAMKADSLLTPFL